MIENLDFFQALFLTLAIAAMFASQGMILLDNLDLVIRLITPVFLFFLINFTLGRLIGKVFKLSYQESTSLIITTLARNAPLTCTGGWLSNKGPFPVFSAPVSKLQAAAAAVHSQRRLVSLDSYHHYRPSWLLPWLQFDFPTASLTRTLPFPAQKRQSIF